MALLDDFPKPVPFGRTERFVGGKVELEPFHIKDIREQDLCFQPWLDDPGSLEIAPRPVEDFTNCPAYCQLDPPSTSTRNTRYCRIE